MLLRLKIMVIFASLLFLISCKTAQKSGISPNQVLNTSFYAANVYAGISGRMTTHEKEVDYAKLHIAHQIAMRDNCVVDAGSISIYGRENNFTISDSNFDYDDSYIDELMSFVEIIETYKFPELVVVIAKDTRKPADANTVILRAVGERPQWVHNPEWVRNLPGLEGYFVGVGIADRYSLFFKGIRVADVRAAQAIAAEKIHFQEIIFQTG
jgi:hypothetical protein